MLFKDQVLIPLCCISNNVVIISYMEGEVQCTELFAANDKCQSAKGIVILDETGSEYKILK